MCDGIEKLNSTVVPDIFLQVWPISQDIFRHDITADAIDDV